MATAAGDYESLATNYEHIFDYFRGAVAGRRTDPRDDLVTALVQAEVDGHQLADDDILGFCALLLIAGNETTTNLIGNAATVLASHPEARAEIVADMSLLPNAIEEVLRFEGPVPTLTRTTTTGVALRGHTIDAGEKVMLLLAAANRDPRVFDDADHFDIHRAARKHIAFGSGIHFCMGANLAHLEARVALEELFSRFPNYRVTADTLSYFNTPSIRGPKALPVRLAG
jgi:cytochrome P450